MWTDDPIADFERYDAEQGRQLDKLPRCCCHEEPIQDEYLYDIDGEYYCEEGMKERFRKSVDSVIGW